MKREKKQLNLTRETLRTLTLVQLSGVAGGGINRTILNGKGNTCTCPTGGGQESADCGGGGGSGGSSNTTADCTV